MGVALDLNSYLSREPVQFLLRKRCTFILKTAFISHPKEYESELAPHGTDKGADRKVSR